MSDQPAMRPAEDYPEMRAQVQQSKRPELSSMLKELDIVLQTLADNTHQLGEHLGPVRESYPEPTDPGGTKSAGPPYSAEMLNHVYALGMRVSQLNQYVLQLQREVSI